MNSGFQSRPPSRPTHRKRISALRLSSDTTFTLPEYRPQQLQQLENDGDDDEEQPPGYPESDSAEEADQSSEEEETATTSQPTSPRRFHAGKKKRKRAAAKEDPLDQLLQRSVHALEMSNALLIQNSISLASPSLPSHSSSTTSIPLSSSSVDLGGDLRHYTSRWEAMGRSVDRLLLDEEDDADELGLPPSSLSRPLSASVSCSLPSSTSPLSRPGFNHTHRRRPSLDPPTSAASHLRFEPQNRQNLISPPPRALTQYVAASSLADPAGGSSGGGDNIMLPSTLGLRGAASLHRGISSPVLTERIAGETTRAYNMLSSFVRSSSSGSSTPAMRRNTSSSSERTRTSISSLSMGEANGGGTSSPRRSRSRTPKPKLSPTTPPLRVMTPPIEESSSSSSDGGCRAKQTVSALRKILDDQPPPPPLPTFTKLHPPPILITPRPSVAEASTSTATASVSRLFTKGVHSSSTRPPSPPRVSSMKGKTPVGTPTSPVHPNLAPPAAATQNQEQGQGQKQRPSHSRTSSIIGVFSRPGSGRSTPKRISFAQLPESYASTRPEGSTSSFRKVSKNSSSSSRRSLDGGKAKSNARRKGKGLDTSRTGEEDAEQSWWVSWLVGPGANSGRGMGDQTRMERGWSAGGGASRMGGHGGGWEDGWGV